MTKIIKKILIINGLRSRSGGSIVHLRNLLCSLNLDRRFEKVILIANKTLRNSTQDYTWLEKKDLKAFDKSPLTSIIWEITSMKLFLKQYLFDGVLLNLDGNYLGPKIIPTVTMSRDMLSFEPGLLKLYFPSKLWVRNYIIKWTQIYAFKRSDGIIFLTRYAQENILKYVNKSRKNCIINHGFNHSKANIKKDFEIKKYS